jgi:enoyl-CoA hydratase
MEQEAPLITQRQDGVLTLTLNRPQARNALNLALTRALVAELLAFEADAGLKVAVVTGSDPAFCAGLDLRDFSTPDAPRHEVVAMIDMWPRLRKPVIAAVNGPAMTGALELALGCDFIVASEKALFGDTHTKIGALAGGGMTARLPQAVGPRWAKQMSYSGVPIDAATALRIGLVNQVLPHGELLAHVQGLAHQIAAMDPALVATVKRVIDGGSMGTLAHGLLLEKDALAERKTRGAMTWNTAKPA